MEISPFLMLHLRTRRDPLSLELEASGYGASGYDLDPHPNVLRGTLRRGKGPLEKDDIAILETNVNNATPEVMDGLQETYTDSGVHGVPIPPAMMKMSCPNHLVKVIYKSEDRQRVARVLAEETGTLGVRDAGTTHRWIAQRKFETEELELEDETYKVTVKIASDADREVYDVSAEYEDTKAIAQGTGLAIRDVIRQAKNVILEDLRGNQ